MARSSSRRNAAPTRSAAKPMGARSSSTTAPAGYSAAPARPAAAAVPAQAAQSSGFGGGFGSMIASGMGLGLGSSVGHMAGNALGGMFGGGSAETAPAPVDASNASAWDSVRSQNSDSFGQNAAQGSCNANLQALTQCLQNNQDYKSCEYLADALKACQAASASY